MGSRLPRALLRICLLTWPRRLRRAHGKELLETTLALLAEGRREAGANEWSDLAGEAWALCRAGAGLRRRGLGRTATEWRVGAMGDVRFAFRTLRRSPGFALVAVLMLALGIGANASVFSLVDQVLLRPPPYRDPDRLVLVWTTLGASRERVPVGGPDAAALSGSVGSFSGVAFTIRGVNGTVQTGAGDEAAHVRLAAVTDNFFSVLGAGTALGRVFEVSDGPAVDAGSEDRGAPAVVIADGLWRSTFGAAPDIVGREVRLNGVLATVVGVMPPDFSLALPPDAGIATDVDVWIPLGVPLSAFHRTGERLLDQDSDNTGAVVARLAPEVTVARAQAEVDALARELAAVDPVFAAAEMGFDVRPLQQDATAHARGILLALLAGVAGVLVVVCLNLATLVMARGIARAGEMDLRMCLGATRARIFRQNLSESLVLVMLGFGAAMAVARVALLGVSTLIPSGLAPRGPLTVDPRTFGFSALVAGGAVLLFGLLPGIGAGVREAGGGPGRRAVRGSVNRARARKILVAAQVALSVVLMLGAGLLLRTVAALDGVHPGFREEGALTFKVSMRVRSRYASPARRAELMKEVEVRLKEIPGVRAVGLTGVLPLGGDRWTQPYGLPGQPESQWRENRADFRVISSGTFDALGTRVLEGRTFTPAEDLREEERVVVVDQRLAARVAPTGSAVGAVIGVPVDGSPVDARIVGVVEDIRYDRVDSEGREAIYVPFRQEASRDVAVVVRTDGDAASLASAIRSKVREVDPQIPVFDVESLEGYVSRAVAPRRFAYVLLSTFALLALLCAATGLYGVMAFDVAGRTRDIGVRMAVGATRLEVIGLVLGSGLRLGAGGLAAGVAAGALATGALRSLVFGVSPSDPLTWGAVVVAVLSVVAVASWLPALRASRMSPSVALRSE